MSDYLTIELTPKQIAYARERIATAVAYLKLTA